MPSQGPLSNPPHAVRVILASPIQESCRMLMSLADRWGKPPQEDLIC